MTKDSNNINIVATSPLASSNVPQGGSCLFVPPLPNLKSHISLLSDRGLAFSTKEETMLCHAIESIGYYQLSTYLKHFYGFPKENKVFRQDAQVTDILKSYETNEVLRQILFKALLKIEDHLKTFLIETFISEFQDAYWCKYQTFAFLNLTAKALETIDLKQKKSKKIAYRYQATRLFFYHYPTHDCTVLPAWVVLQCQDFGTLSLLLRFPKNKTHHKQVKAVLQKLAQKINLPRSLSLNELYDVYNGLRYLRNEVVHGGKLLGECPHISPPVYDTHAEQRTLTNTLKWVLHLIQIIEPNGDFEEKLNQLRNEVCATLPKDLHF